MSERLASRVQAVMGTPEERLRLVAVGQAWEIVLLHRLIESMALHIPREHLPDDERMMLDIILEPEP